MVEVARIIDKFGYPGKSLVGMRAAGGAWTVLQHAPLETLRKYLGMMQEAAEKGELGGGLVATSVDRVLVADGKPQLYGTQFHDVNGEMVPQPIEDEAHVDERRAKMGMGTLAEYASMMKQMYQRKP